MLLFLGIDPGKKGGLAFLRCEECTNYSDPRHCKVLSAVATPMPENDEGIADWLMQESGQVPHMNCIHGAMEKVTGYVAAVKTRKTKSGEDSKPEPGSAMFNFGRNYGKLEMALTMLGLRHRVQSVHPRTWQKALGCKRIKNTDVVLQLDGSLVSNGDNHLETESEFKVRLRGIASHLFPKINVTLATADALLLAEYARRMYLERSK